MNYTQGTQSTTGGTGTNNLTGSAYDWSNVYGGKANVQDPTASAASAISGSGSNLASLYDLGSSLNTYQTSEAVKSAEAATPGYTANMDKWANDIADLLAGKVSSGTVNTISQAAAERGVSSGIAGSQANESSLLRALGLTSEGLQATGASQLQQMIGVSPKVNLFDYNSYLTSPSDVGAAQYAANTIASAATPADAAAAATDAAKSGVTAGLNAAGTAPAGSNTGSSIASLLSQILGTGAGSGSGGVTGMAAGTGAGNNLSFTDWYNQVYGNAVPDNSNNEVTPLATGGGLEGGYDANTFDAGVYA